MVYGRFLLKILPDTQEILAIFEGYELHVSTLDGRFTCTTINTVFLRDLKTNVAVVIYLEIRKKNV